MIYYDYLNIEVKKHFKWIYTQYYPCFGWELLESMSSETKRSDIQLAFRRKHDLQGRDRLSHYQQKFDHYMKELRNFEQLEKFTALLSGVAVGMIGALFLISALYLLVQGETYGLLLMIPGAISLFFVYPCYNAMLRSKKRQVEPYIKEYYDEIYETCKKAKKVLEQG